MRVYTNFDATLNVIFIVSIMILFDQNINPNPSWLLIRHILCKIWIDVPTNIIP